MLFPKRQSLIQQYTGNAALGAQITFNIPRTFFLDSLILRVPVTVASTATSPFVATSNALWAAVANIQLQISDGSQNRLQTNASGAATIKMAGNILNGLDIATLRGSSAYLNNTQTATTDNTTYMISYPLLFKDPQLSDPVGSAFMLPLPRYNTNPILQVTFGVQTDMISTANSAVVTIGTPYLLVNYRQVPNINFATWDTEFIENIQAYPTTGANQVFLIQPIGNYTGINLYMTNSSNVATDITNAPTILQYLGTTLRSFNTTDIKMEENFSQGNDSYLSNYNATSTSTVLTDYFPNNYHLDFLHDGYGLECGEMGSVLNCNLLAGSGTQAQFLFSTGTAGSVSVAWRRIFGDLSPFQMSLANSTQ